MSKTIKERVSQCVTLFMFSKVKSKIGEGIAGIKEGFKDSEKIVILFFPMLASLVIGLLLMGSGLPIVIDLCLFIVGVYVGLWLIRKILHLFLKPIFALGTAQLLAMVSFGAAIYVYQYTCVWGKGLEVGLLVNTCIITLMEWVFIKSVYIVVIKRRKHLLPMILLVMSMVSNIGLMCFLFGDGTNNTMILEILSYEKEEGYGRSKEEPAFTQAITAGESKVLTVTYGDGKEDAIQTETVNLENYIYGYDGLRKWLRETYQGYDINHVPLSGKVWYPEGKANCPTVFIIHGNHTMITPSYLGYEYIGEHLASKGYVVVSVDENVLNYYIDQGLSGENNARAILLLENIEALLLENGNKNSVLYQAIDTDKLALLGHSRGGEAVALAQMYNQFGTNPDNGNIRYYYDFSIQSIVAIAPSVNQYMPAGKEVVVTDTNYLVIQGASDGDVDTFQGYKQYNNIVFTGEKDCYKAYKYIYGANHGQFNTTWLEDCSFPRNLLINRAEIMEGDRQRNLLLTYVTAFLEDTLGEDRKYRSIFQEESKEESALASTMIQSGYHSSTFDCIADFEEDANPLTVTKEEVTVTSYGLSYWREYRNQLELSWQEKGGTYSLRFQEGADTPLLQNENGVFQFDVRNPELFDGELVNFSVTFIDNKGEEVIIPLNEIRTIYPTVLVRLYKIQIAKNQMDAKSEFQTIRIPFSEIKEKNQEFSLEGLTSIVFTMDQTQTGTVYMDNIGFSLDE